MNTSAFFLQNINRTVINLTECPGDENVGDAYYENILSVVGFCVDTGRKLYKLYCGLRDTSWSPYVCVECIENRTHVNLYDYNWTGEVFHITTGCPLVDYTDAGGNCWTCNLKNLTWQNPINASGAGAHRLHSNYDWTFLILVAFIFAGGLGNILVCLAIILDRRLQNFTNYFLLSLAIADLLVSLFVMPMGIIPGFMGEQTSMSYTFPIVCLASRMSHLVHFKCNSMCSLPGAVVIFI